jgi:hypothetical protein
MREPEMICPKRARFRLASGLSRWGRPIPTALALGEVVPKKTVRGWGRSSAAEHAGTPRCTAYRKIG